MTNKDEDSVENEEVETTEENVQEGRPKKRLVRRRKSKKERESPISQAIRLAVESGKVEFGSRKSIKNSLLGKAKLFVIASNAPKNVVAEITKNSTHSKIPVLNFEGSTLDLGSICGNPYPVSVLSVYEAGSSNILDLVKK